MSNDKMRNVLKRLVAVNHTHGGSLQPDGAFHYRVSEEIFKAAELALASAQQSAEHLDKSDTLSCLAFVIDQLRENCQVIDEEGELTNELERLLTLLATPSPAPEQPKRHDHANLIHAALAASRQGLAPGTTSWAAFVMDQLYPEVYDEEPCYCTVCGGSGFRHGERHSQCGQAVMAAERKGREAAPEQREKVELTASVLKVGGKYNWKGQPERLVYLGRELGWHQFAKVDEPRNIWSEVLGEDLHMLEDTQEAAHEAKQNGGEG